MCFHFQWDVCCYATIDCLKYCKMFVVNDYSTKIFDVDYENAIECWHLKSGSLSHIHLHCRTFYKLMYDNRSISDFQYDIHGYTSIKSKCSNQPLILPNPRATLQVPMYINLARGLGEVPKYINQEKPCWPNYSLFLSSFMCFFQSNCCIQNLGSYSIRVHYL